MAVYKRNEIPRLLKAIESGKSCHIYLVCGDRFLCDQATEQLIAILIPDQASRGKNVKLIDGDNEDQLNTLNTFRSYSLFSGKQVLRVNNSKLFHSKAVAKRLWGMALKAFEDEKYDRSALHLQSMAQAGGVSVNDLQDLPKEKWKKAFEFARPPEKITWIDEVLKKAGSEKIKESTPSGDITEYYMKIIEDGGVPEDNILILLAETVDKRKKFYKFVLKHGVVIDLSIDSGSTKAARDDQEKVLTELINKTLSDFGKKIERKAAAALLERVGFHPVAVVRETEKLALHAGESELITYADLQAIVGRTREEAIFELTEAYADQNLEKALLVSARLMEAGIHPLALISGIRNQIKKLMLVCSFRASSPPVFVEGMTFAVFQKGYLPELKAEKEQWLAQLPNHPYALYMMFNKAKKHSVERLSESLKELLRAEYRLKSSGLPPLIVFENFLHQAIFS